MKYTEEMIKKVANNITNDMYKNNLQATKELMELFDYLKKSRPNNYITIKPLEDWEDYVKNYDDNFYTYRTFDELVKSEEYIGGLTESECMMKIGNTIWRLPCGWYVQYV